MTTEKRSLKVGCEYEKVAEQLENNAAIKAEAALEIGGWTGMELMREAQSLRLQAQRLRQQHVGENMKHQKQVCNRGVQDSVTGHGHKVTIFEQVLSEFATNPYVHSLQQNLAAHYRRSTGTVPRGQLWQPCIVPGCEEEPVCMNCMRCQKTHCDCFKS